MNYKQKLHKIKAIFLDVDGVLTDNTVLLTGDGNMCRTMNVKDGYAMQYAVKQGLILAIITGGRDEQVKKRMQYLGVPEIYLGIQNKLEIFQEISQKYGLSTEEILYMGDDIPDLEAMMHAGVSVCPKDAVPEILAIADYVSPLKGGNACVREILEQVLKVQGKWALDFQIKSN